MPKSRRSSSRKERSPERDVKGAKDGFPRGRLIWARLFEPEAMEEGQDNSYSCAIRFDADADLDALREGFKAACVDKFGSSKPPRRSRSCFLEGDELADLIDEGKMPAGTEPDMVILKLRRYEKYGPPQLWDQNIEPIESPTEMYSGCHVIADVSFYAWARTTGSGVSCVVNGIQKVREDEPLGGGKNETEDSFTKVKVDKKRGRKADDDDDEDDEDERPRGRTRRRSNDDVV